MTINSFKIAEIIIRYICKKKNLQYSNFSISFEESDVLKDRTISINNSKSILETNYIIISEYINNYNELFNKDSLTDEDKKKILQTVSFLINKICISNGIEQEYSNFKPFVNTLSSKPLIWFFMRNLIAPHYNIPIKNIKIAAVESSFIEPAKFIKNWEKLDNQDCIILNMNVKNIITRNIFIILETLLAHDLNPFEVIKEMFEDSNLENMKGLFKFYFQDEDDLNGLIEGLVCFSSLYNSKDLQKNAQVNSSELPSYAPWWLYGLIEQMLEGSRGFDWTIRENLWTKDIKKFWDSIEEYKNKNNGQSIPVEQLLRVRWDKMSLDDSQKGRTLQQLLSEDRVSKK
jgi:hypothetical protein